MSSDAPITAAELPTLWRASDVAKALACSERTVWTLTQTNKLRAVHIGKLVRYELGDVQAFIMASKGQTT